MKVGNPLYSLILNNRFVKNDDIGELESTLYSNYHYMGEVTFSNLNGKVRGIDYTKKVNGKIYSHIHEIITLKNLGKIYIERNGNEVYEDNHNDDIIILKGDGKCITPIESLKDINDSQLLWKATINKSELNFIVEVTIYVE